MRRYLYIHSDASIIQNSQKLESFHVVIQVNITQLLKEGHSDTHSHDFMLSEIRQPQTNHCMTSLTRGP